MVERRKSRRGPADKLVRSHSKESGTSVIGTGEVSPCFGYPHTQIPSEMGIPGGDTQNTESLCS